MTSMPSPGKTVGARVKLSWAPNRVEVQLVATHTVIMPVSGTFATRVFSIGTTVDVGHPSPLTYTRSARLMNLHGQTEPLQPDRQPTVGIASRTRRWVSLFPDQITPTDQDFAAVCSDPAPAETLAIGCNGQCAIDAFASRVHTTPRYGLGEKYVAVGTPDSFQCSATIDLGVVRLAAIRRH